MIAKPPRCGTRYRRRGALERAEPTIWRQGSTSRARLLCRVGGQRRDPAVPLGSIDSTSWRPPRNSSGAGGPQRLDSISISIPRFPLLVFSGTWLAHSVYGRGCGQMDSDVTSGPLHDDCGGSRYVGIREERGTSIPMDVNPKRLQSDEGWPTVITSLYTVC